MKVVRVRMMVYRWNMRVAQKLGIIPPLGHIWLDDADAMWAIFGAWGIPKAQWPHDLSTYNPVDLSKKPVSFCGRPGLTSDALSAHMKRSGKRPRSSPQNHTDTGSSPHHGLEKISTLQSDADIKTVLAFARSRPHVILDNNIDELYRETGIKTNKEHLTAMVSKLTSRSSLEAAMTANASASTTAILRVVDPYVPPTAVTALTALAVRSPIVTADRMREEHNKRHRPAQSPTSTSWLKLEPVESSIVISIAVPLQRRRDERRAS